MDRQPWLGNVQATPQVTSPSHLRCTTKDFREAAETLLFKEPYTIPGRQKDATAIRISSYFSLACFALFPFFSFFSFFYFFIFFCTPYHHLCPLVVRVFERRVLSRELHFEAVRVGGEFLILPLTIKFFAVSFPLRRSPVLLFTKALEPFAGLRSQFDRPSLFIVSDDKSS